MSSGTTPFDCPRCGAGLAMSERQGIEIDYCPQCRGVWLDRGELDKVITRSEAAQIIAELLSLRATAKMKDAAQTLTWNSVRPASEPSSSGRGREELPIPGNTAKAHRPERSEGEIGAGGEVSDGSRHDDLSIRGLS